MRGTGGQAGWASRPTRCRAAAASRPAMAQILLVALPKNKDKSNSAFSAVANDLSALSRCNRVDIPNLVVGTLDSLLGLSDELVKSASQVENVVKKLERQYIEIAGADAKPLRVKETAVEAYFQGFQWDAAQFQHQGKQLVELVGQIQSMAGKTEDELKTLATSFQEKTVALAAAKRRKVINLATSDFEDFLRPEHVARAEFLNTEHLITVTVVVPKIAEQDFLKTYESIGSDIANYGGPDWSKSPSVGQDDGKFGPALDRSRVKGSPVVPGSAKKVYEEGETALYAITILRGQYQAGIYVDNVFTAGAYVEYLEPVKAAFREKRFMVRELNYDSAKAGGVDSAIDHATNELKQVKATTVRWCRGHFGEIYGGWVHLKLVQAFVESVLLYGLPAEFVMFFATFEAKSEKEVKAQLIHSVLTQRPELRPKKGMVLDEEEGDSAESSLPFVCLKFPMVGAIAGPA